MVNLRTIRFNDKNLYVPPTKYNCVFLCISEQTVYISPFNINGLDIVTETEGVYCALLRGMNQIFKYNLG